ncbi:MAG: hypothetical protein H0U65_03665 [Rubrobacter sp.]|jgi:hypothetical protein|nr:hypothetical protein [Rubrobacter sp.]
MTGYLIDEGGERTHAVIPIEEHERLKGAAARVESIRAYTQQIMAAMDEEGQAENGQAENGRSEGAWADDADRGLNRGM